MSTVLSGPEIITPATLPELAERANDAHRAVEAAGAEMLEHAMLAGDCFIDAKSGLAHGEWLRWLGANFEGSRRQAYVYTQLAHGRDLIEANLQTSASLSLQGALKLLGSKDPALGGAVSESDDYDSDEWYTPPKYIEAARKVMGGIDLDPASCEHANRSIRAAQIYTKDRDGLSQRWSGRVWLNPPYSQPLAENFCAKLLFEYEEGRIEQAIIVQNAGTDTGWFHDLAVNGTICLTRGRINFDREDGGSSANRYGQAFFYFGGNSAKFRVVFGEFGLIGELR